MLGVIIREFIVMSRRSAITVALCTHVAILGAFVLAWSGGSPILSGGNVFEQEQIIQWVVLAVLLPWTAARCIAADQGDSLVLACAAAAIRPSTFVVGKTIALATALTVVAMAALPITVAAQQISAVPLSVEISGFVSLLSLSWFVAVVTVTWAIAVRRRLLGWMGASASTAAALLLASRLSTADALQALFLTALGLILAVGARTWNDRAFCYLSEGHD
jgi:hypothetical protein